MFICEYCGKVFDEPKMIGHDVDRGYVCPDCGRDDFDEAYQCALCGDWVASDKIHGYGPYVCEDCINEHRYDLDTLMKATEDQTFEFSIPALARYILDDDDINALIRKELERRLQLATDKFMPYPYDFDTKDFIDDYANDIADYISRKEEA